jgi:MSHA biogenesis protein MshJ
MNVTVRRWLGQRTLRERLLAAGALLVLVALAFDGLVSAPQRAKDAALKRQITEQRAAIAALHAQLDAQAAANDQQQHAQADALAQRRVAAERVIREAQVDLIAPQDMSKQLGVMLARHPQLRVVGMTTLAPAQLGDALPASPAGAAAAPRPTTGGLYQHGLELTVEGKYLDVLAWLQALEKAPHRIYWRELDMQVNGDGLPVTRITIFTLSREAVWMRL